jgi:hypothetical protein
MERFGALDGNCSRCGHMFGKFGYEPMRLVVHEVTPGSSTGAVIEQVCGFCSQTLPEASPAEQEVPDWLVVTGLDDDGNLLYVRAER